jgi:hypothetical protein
MKRYAKLPTLLAFLVVLAAGRVAMAALAHPASWKQVSDDGQYVLVMVSPLSVDQDAGHHLADGNEIRQIRAKFSQSGLYQNDGSTTPIWTIEYFSRPHELHIAPDGEHLIVGADDWFVACFFAKGKKLAGYGYSVSDLVSFIRVKSLVSFRYPSCVWSDFDANKLRYTVRTNQGETFVFDVTTGGVVETHSPWLSYFLLSVAGVVAASGFATALASRRGGRRPKANKCAAAR